MEELKNEKELERVKLTYYELPILVHKILQIRLMPGMVDKELLEMDIQDIKKIINAECENALNYLEKVTKA